MINPNELAWLRALGVPQMGGQPVSAPAAAGGPYVPSQAPTGPYVPSPGLNPAPISGGPIQPISQPQAAPQGPISSRFNERFPRLGQAGGAVQNRASNNPQAVGAIGNAGSAALMAGATAPGGRRSKNLAMLGAAGAAFSDAMRPTPPADLMAVGGNIYDPNTGRWIEGPQEQSNDPPPHIEKIGPDDKVHYYGWNPQSRQYDIDLGVAPEANPLVNVNTGDEADVPQWVNDLWEGESAGLVERRQQTVDAIGGMDNDVAALNLLNNGINLGPLASAETFLATLGVSLGWVDPDAPEAQRAANTQAYVANRGEAVAQVIQQFGAGTGLSDADREYARQVAGGDIAMTEQAIRNILRMSLIANYNLAQNYAAEVEAMRQAAGDRPLPPTLNVPMPEYLMSQMPAIVAGWEQERDQVLRDALGVERFNQLDRTATPQPSVGPSSTGRPTELTHEIIISTLPQWVRAGYTQDQAIEALAAEFGITPDDVRRILSRPN